MGTVLWRAQPSSGVLGSLFRTASSSQGTQDSWQRAGSASPPHGDSESSQGHSPTGLLSVPHSSRVPLIFPLVTFPIQFFLPLLVSVTVTYPISLLSIKTHHPACPVLEP